MFTQMKCARSAPATHIFVPRFFSMDTEVSRWLSSISCGLDLKPLAKEFEDRGFTTKQSLKYVESSDLDIFFPSPLKLSYAHKKILLKEIEQLSNQDNAQAPISTLPTAGTSYAQVPSTSQGNSSKLSEPSSSFLAKKDESFSDEVQFLQTRIASAKQEHTRLQQQASEYDEAAPKRGKTCSNCHLPGHDRRQCKNPTCSGISQCNIQSKHPEIKAEITELQGLIKDLEKRSEKSKTELLNFKAAREKASNSFFAIMRPRLKKSNAMKYAGTDRLLLDRDLLTLKKALNNKVPVNEYDDWQLPLIIEQFSRRNIAPFQAGSLATEDGLKSFSSRKLTFPPLH